MLVVVAAIDAKAIVAVLAPVLGLAGAVPVVRAAVQMRDTTLLSPCLWALAAIGLASGAETAIALTGGGAWAEPMRYIAAVLALCPAMAVMGAKRPQQLPWQFIVASLWAVLALPAFEVLLIHPGRPLDVQDLRSWFLPVIVLLGAANFLATRYWPSAMLAAVAQIVLLAGHLPLIGAPLGATGSLIALVLVDVAILLAAFRFPRRRSPDHPLDCVWIDFRDAFGALWALRLAERVNATARQFEWDLALQWHGFTRADGSGSAGDISPQVLASLRPALKNLLRRFVSPRWIESRLGRDLE